MKQGLVWLVALAVALLAAASAQGKANFSGTWLLDRLKSDPAPAPVGGGQGAVVAAAMGALTTLKVGQTQTELTIKEDEVTHRLDGRESVNKVPNGEFKTKASWDGAKLVLASTYTVTTSVGKVDVQVKEVWSVDADVLTIERTANTSEGSKSRKLVYNRT